jgi:hypothetical protein
MWDLFGFSNLEGDSYGQQASDIYNDLSAGGRKGKKATEGLIQRGTKWFDETLDYSWLPKYKDTDLAKMEEVGWGGGPGLGYPTAALTRGLYGIADIAGGSPFRAATTAASLGTVPLAKFAYQGPELLAKYGPKVAKYAPKVAEGVKNIARGLDFTQGARMSAETLEDLKQGRYGKAAFDALGAGASLYGASGKPYDYFEGLYKKDAERKVQELADVEMKAKGFDPDAKLPLSSRPVDMPPPTKAVDETGVQPSSREVKAPKGTDPNNPFWTPALESSEKFAVKSGGDVELMAQARRGGPVRADQESLTRLQGAVDRVAEGLKDLTPEQRTTKSKASLFALELNERDLSLAQSLGIIDPDVGTAAREIRKGFSSVPTQMSARPVDRGIGSQITDDAPVPIRTDVPTAPAVAMDDLGPIKEGEMNPNAWEALPDSQQPPPLTPSEQAKLQNFATNAPWNESPVTNAQLQATSENVQAGKNVAAEALAAPKIIEHVGDDPVKINEKTWYHGTGTKGLTPETLDPYRTEIDGLFGSGVYLTDADKISEGYAAARGKRTKTPTVYEAKVNVEKVLDLEKPITPEVRSALDKQVEGLESIGFEMDSVKALPEGTTTEAYWRAIANEVFEQGEGLNISKSELTETFHDMRYALSDLGYDAMTHTGGKRTGKAPHQVLIILDPANEAGKGNRITSFGERGAAQVEEALPASITGAADDSLPAGLVPETTTATGTPLRSVTQGVDPSALPPGIASTGETIPSGRPVEPTAGTGGAGGTVPPGGRDVLPPGESGGDFVPKNPERYQNSIQQEEAHRAWMEDILKNVTKNDGIDPGMAIDRANRQLGPDVMRKLKKMVQDPNTPVEMRNRIVARLRDEAGLGPKPIGAIAKFKNDISMAMREEFKRMGPVGREIGQLIERTNTDAARRFNRYINPVVEDLERLKKDPKTFEQIVDYLEGNNANPTEEVREIGDKMRAINDMIGDEMVNAGLIEKKRANYWTHRYEGVPDQTLIDAMKKQGLPDDVINKRIKDIAASRERKIGEEFRRNDLNVPGYRKDMDVFVDHLRNSARRVEEANAYGKLDLQDETSAISKLVAKAEDPERARNLAQRSIRGEAEGVSSRQKSLVGAARIWATASQLSLAGISNISGVLPIAVKGRLRDAGPALLKAFKGNTDPDAKFMNNVGTFRQFSGGFAETLGDKNFLYKVFGIEGTQNYLNRVAGATGNSYARILFDELNRNPANKKARRELEDLTFTSPEQLVRQTELSQDQLERAMIRMADLTQGSMANVNLPHGWVRNDILRIPQTFMRTAFQTTKTMKDAIKENPTRAVKLAAIGMSLGELIGDTKEVVKTGAQVGTNSAQQMLGMTDEDKDFFTEYKNNIGQSETVDPSDRFAFTRKWLGKVDPQLAKNEGIVHGLGNLEQAFALGIPTDYMTSIAENWDDPDPIEAAFNMMRGTNYAVDEAAGIGGLAINTLRGNYRDVGRWGLQRVPYVGRGIAREVETTAQQKRKKKGGRSSVAIPGEK